jgi:hypothetical protein
MTIPATKKLSQEQLRRDRPEDREAAAAAEIQFLTAQTWRT